MSRHPKSASSGSRPAPRIRAPRSGRCRWGTRPCRSPTNMSFPRGTPCRKCRSCADRSVDRRSPPDTPLSPQDTRAPGQRRTPRSCRTANTTMVAKQQNAPEAPSWPKNTQSIRTRGRMPAPASVRRAMECRPRLRYGRGNASWIAESASDGSFRLCPDPWVFRLACGLLQPRPDPQHAMGSRADRGIGVRAGVPSEYRLQ